MRECGQIRDWLIVQEELDAEERRRVETHLAGCPECAREAASLRDLLERVQALPVPEPAAAFWGVFEATVRRRVAEAPAPHPGLWVRATSWLGGSWRVPALAAATALGLLLAFGLVKSRQPQREVPPVEILAVGEELAIGQNLEVLENLDLFEEIEVVERLDLLQRLDGGGRPRLS
ncbi:MAG TPA: zf-HC2 domain-containing protein [Candidatus Acidoferrum sp.]|nr:zf-HC2 domain-containing protein [Candidatus Acidoferrum sp.]